MGTVPHVFLISTFLPWESRKKCRKDLGITCTIGTIGKKSQKSQRDMNLLTQFATIKTLPTKKLAEVFKTEREVILIPIKFTGNEKMFPIIFSHV